MSDKAEQRQIHERLTAQAVALIADRQTQHITEATQRVFGDAQRLRHLAGHWRNVAADKVQGRMFEQLSVAKFNLDALQKGKTNTFAFTTDSIGKPHDRVDVFVQQAKKRFGYQLKSCNKAVSSLVSLTDMLGGAKYKGLLRLAPSEQYEKIKFLLEERVKAGSLKQAQYEDTLRNLRSELHLDGVSSGQTTYKEALKATSQKHADQMASGFEKNAIAAEMHRSGLEAGNIGAAVAGGVSGVSGLLRLARGDADTGEIAVQVAVDAAKGYATSYVTAAISKGVPHAIVKAGVTQSTANFLTKSNAHLAIAAGVVQSGKSLVKYLNGEIDDDQLLTEISGTAITGASAFYYGALGQALIPIPVVGAFVGSTVGYFVGNMLHQSGLISLGEADVVRVSRERREKVEALCMTAIPLMRAHRLELDALLEHHFAERRHLLCNAFDDMEGALVAWNADGFTRSLEQVNNAFGASLPFRNFNEFDSFMKDDNTRFVL